MNTRLHHLAEAHNARFGTSGVRGLVSDLSDAVCYAYAQAFLRSIATDSPRVVVGHDSAPEQPAHRRGLHPGDPRRGTRGGVRRRPAHPALATTALQRARASSSPAATSPSTATASSSIRADGEIDKADEQAILDAEVAVPDALSPAPLPAVTPPRWRATWRATPPSSANLRPPGCAWRCTSTRAWRATCCARCSSASAPRSCRSGAPTPSCRSTPRPCAPRTSRRRARAQAHRFDAIVSTDGDADRPLIGDETGTRLRGDVVASCVRSICTPSVVVNAGERWRSAAFRQVSDAHRLALRDRRNLQRPGGGGDEANDSCSGRCRGRRSGQAETAGVSAVDGSAEPGFTGLIQRKLNGWWR